MKKNDNLIELRGRTLRIYPTPNNYIDIQVNLSEDNKKKIFNVIEIFKNIRDLFEKIKK